VENKRFVIASFLIVLIFITNNYLLYKVTIKT